MTLRHPSIGTSCGFTVIELLVATAVLALMVVFIAEIISMAGRTVARTEKRQGAESDSRLSLDRLGADLSAGIFRPDVPIEAVKTPGNDTLHFYSGVEGYGGSRRVSAVSYRIGTNANLLELERGAVAAGWTNAGVAFQGSFPTIANSDHEVLAESILRLELAFLKSDGSLQTNAAANLEDVRSVVVAVAAVDPRTRGVISTSDLEKIADALPDAVNNKTPIETWEASGARNGISGVSPQATQGLRFYQRYYHVR